MLQSSVIEKIKDSAWRLILFVPTILIFFVLLCASLVTVGFIDPIPINQEETVISGFLTAASILFGFTSSYLIHFFDRIRDIQQRASDVAKELCDLYRQIENDDKLSAKNLAYKTQIVLCKKWGKDSGYNANDNALATIKNAYNFLMVPFRTWIGNETQIIYIMQGSALLSLGTSIIFGLLFYASVLTETTLFSTVWFFIISIPIISLGLLLSQQLLTKLEETVFNVRQQIHGGLADLLPYDYKKP